jgi:hypothetical protein
MHVCRRHAVNQVEDEGLLPMHLLCESSGGGEDCGVKTIASCNGSPTLVAAAAVTAAAAAGGGDDSPAW